jgi:hypothetical protein
MRRFQVLAAMGAAAALATASPASAHTHLLRSTPAANATLSASPRTITLTFNERVLPRFSKFEVTMPAHQMEIPVQIRVSRDGKRLIGTPRSRLTKGSYKIVWTAAGSDGHKMTGEVAFRVA